MPLYTIYHLSWPCCSLCALHTPIARGTLVVPGTAPAAEVADSGCVSDMLEKTSPNLAFHWHIASELHSCSIRYSDSCWPTTTIGDPGTEGLLWAGSSPCLVSCRSRVGLVSVHSSMPSAQVRSKDNLLGLDTKAIQRHISCAVSLPEHDLQLLFRACLALRLPLPDTPLPTPCFY